MSLVDAPNVDLGFFSRSKRKDCDHILRPHNENVFVHGNLIWSKPSIEDDRNMHLCLISLRRRKKFALLAVAGRAVSHSTKMTAHFSV